MLRRQLVAAITLALLLAGCVSTMKVQRVDGGSPAAGVRYALPVPFLEACPGPDGTLTVREVFLPDDANTYAISAHTVGAKFNLDVDLENGMLTKLAWNPDSTAVAEKVVESAGNIAKAKIDADAAAAKEAETKAAAAETARKAALEAADKAVHDAEGKLAVAIAALEALRQLPSATPAQLVEAEVAVAKARVELDNAMRARARVVESATGVPGGNAPEMAHAPCTPSAPAGDDPAKACGCVLYSIIETRDSVELRPVKEQMAFETSFKAGPPAPPLTPKTADIRFRPEVSRVVRPTGKAKALILMVGANVPVDEVKVDSFVQVGNTGETELPSERHPALTPGPAGFRVDLPDDTPSGKYRLDFEYKSPGRSNEVKSVEFEVRR